MHYSNASLTNSGLAVVGVYKAAVCNKEMQHSERELYSLVPKSVFSLNITTHTMI